MVFLFVRTSSSVVRSEERDEALGTGLNFQTRDGKDLWRTLRFQTFKDQKVDVHTQSMRKYRAVPQWWFIIVLIFTVMVTIGVCEGFNKQVQLSWWGVLFPCSLAFFFTLPIGAIKGTTNQVCCVYIIVILLIFIGLISYFTNDTEAWSKHYFLMYFWVYITGHTSGHRLL